MSSEGPKNGLKVAVGKDRLDRNRLSIWGMIPLSVKISTEDTGGRLFMFEHTHMGKGGPPRHVHHEQDEWFYVVAGEFAMEVGEENFRLTAGDSLFAPRKVPHAWAQVSDEPGTLITMVSPAGTFEDFILETTRHATLPTQAEVNAAFAAHDMTVVGPPLTVD